MLKLVRCISCCLLLLMSTRTLFGQGDSWEQTGGPKNAGVTAIAIKSGDTVYAGTSHGVMRSIDGGVSWQETGLEYHAGGVYPVYVVELKISPSGELFALTDGPPPLGYSNIYRSDDGGVSWMAANGGLEETYLWCLEVSSAGELFAGSYLGLFRSTDSGTHWTQVSNHTVGKLAINDSGHIFLGGGYPSEWDIGRIFRSTDHGSNWVDLIITTGCHDIAINDQGHIFLATNDGLYRSTDNGASWLHADSGWIETVAVMSGDTLFAATHYCGLARSTDNGGSWTWTELRQDFSALAASPQGHVFAGGASLFRSSNGGDTWSRSDVGWGSFYGLDIICGMADTLYAAEQGAIPPLLFRSADNGATWIELQTGGVPLENLCISPRGHLFTGSWGGSFQSSYRSTDGGEHWQCTHPFTFYYSLVFNDQGDIFAISGGPRIVRSTDNGNTYAELGSVLEGQEPRSLTMSSRGVLYVVTQNQSSNIAGVFRSKDNGASWQPIDAGLPESSNWYLTTSTNGKLFARTCYKQGYQVPQDSAGNNVFCSTDEGDSWIYLYSLPPSWDGKIVADAAGSLFAVVSDSGIWRDGEPWNKGLTDLSVRDISLNSRGYLFAAGNGPVFRSVLPTTEIEKLSPIQIPTAFLLEQNYPNPFNPKTVVRSQLPVVSNVKLVVHNLLGQEVAVLVNERRAAGRYEDTFDGSGLASGVYVYRLTAGSFTQSRTMILLK